MCDPLTLAIAAGTTLGQSAMQSAAAEDVADARAAAQDRFYNDLDERRAESNEAFQDSLQDVSRENTEQNRQEAITERIDTVNRNFDRGEDAGTMLPGQGDANDAVRTSVVNAQNRAAASNEDDTQRLAALQAFGDADLARNIALTENARQINEQGNFARGANNVLSADMRAANQAGADKQAMADAIGAVGTIAGAAAGGMGGGATLDQGTAQLANQGSLLPSVDPISSNVLSSAGNSAASAAFGGLSQNRNRRSISGIG